jgi:chemotaxis response regulator CheB
MGDLWQGPGRARLIAIVMGSGGLDALQVIFGGLPPEFQVPILVVEAGPDRCIRLVVDRLAERWPIPVTLVADGQVPQPGQVYMTGIDHNTIIEQGHLRLVEHKDPLHSAKDILFRSVARELGPGAVAVILSGLGKEGAEGMREVRYAGGHTIAQDEPTSLVYGTARFAVGLDAVCESLPLQEIASRLVSLGSPS